MHCSSQCEPDEDDVRDSRRSGLCCSLFTAALFGTSYLVPEWAFLALGGIITGAFFFLPWSRQPVHIVFVVLSPVLGLVFAWLYYVFACAEDRLHLQTLHHEGGECSSSGLASVTPEGPRQVLNGDPNSVSHRESQMENDGADRLPPPVLGLESTDAPPPVTGLFNTPVRESRRLAFSSTLSCWETFLIREYYRDALPVLELLLLGAMVLVSPQVIPAYTVDPVTSLASASYSGSDMVGSHKQISACHEKEQLYRAGAIVWDTDNYRYGVKTFPMDCSLKVAFLHTWFLFSMDMSVLLTFVVGVVHLGVLAAHYRYLPPATMFLAAIWLVVPILFLLFACVSHLCSRRSESKRIRQGKLRRSECGAVPDTEYRYMDVDVSGDGVGGREGHPSGGTAENRRSPQHDTNGRSMVDVSSYGAFTATNVALPGAYSDYGGGLRPRSCTGPVDVGAVRSRAASPRFSNPSNFALYSKDGRQYQSATHLASSWRCRGANACQGRRTNVRAVRDPLYVPERHQLRIDFGLPSSESLITTAAALTALHPRRRQLAATSTYSTNHDAVTCVPELVRSRHPHEAPYSHREGIEMVTPTQREDNTPAFTYQGSHSNHVVGTARPSSTLPLNRDRHADILPFDVATEEGSCTPFLLLSMDLVVIKASPTFASVMGASSGQLAHRKLSDLLAWLDVHNAAGILGVLNEVVLSAIDATSVTSAVQPTATNGDAQPQGKRLTGTTAVHMMGALALYNHRPVNITRATSEVRRLVLRGCCPTYVKRQDPDSSVLLEGTDACASPRQTFALCVDAWVETTLGARPVLVLRKPLLQSTCDQMPLPVMLLHPTSGRVLFWNRYAEQMTGCAAYDILGWPALTYMQSITACGLAEESVAGAPGMPSNITREAHVDPQPPWANEGEGSSGDGAVFTDDAPSGPYVASSHDVGKRLLSSREARSSPQPPDGGKTRTLSPGSPEVMLHGLIQLPAIRSANFSTTSVTSSSSCGFHFSMRPLDSCYAVEEIGALDADGADFNPNWALRAPRVIGLGTFSREKVDAVHNGNMSSSEGGEAVQDEWTHRTTQMAHLSPPLRHHASGADGLFPFGKEGNDALRVATLSEYSRLSLPHCDNYAAHMLEEWSRTSRPLLVVLEQPVSTGGLATGNWAAGAPYPSNSSSTHPRFPDQDKLLQNRVRAGSSMVEAMELARDRMGEYQTSLTTPRKGCHLPKEDDIRRITDIAKEVLSWASSYAHNLPYTTVNTSPGARNASVTKRYPHARPTLTPPSGEEQRGEGNTDCSRNSSMERLRSAGATVEELRQFHRGNDTVVSEDGGHPQTTVGEPYQSSVESTRDPMGETGSLASSGYAMWTRTNHQVIEGMEREAYVVPVSAAGDQGPLLVATPSRRGGPPLTPLPKSSGGSHGLQAGHSARGDTQVYRPAYGNAVSEATRKANEVTGKSSVISDCADGVLTAAPRPRKGLDELDDPAPSAVPPLNEGVLEDVRSAALPQNTDHTGASAAGPLPSTPADRAPAPTLVAAPHDASIPHGASADLVLLHRGQAPMLISPILAAETGSITHGGDGPESRRLPSATEDTRGTYIGANSSVASLAQRSESPTISSPPHHSGPRPNSAAATAVVTSAPRAADSKTAVEMGSVWAILLSRDETTIPTCHIRVPVGKEFRFGRSSKCNVTLTDTFVSSIQFSIVREVIPHTKASRHDRHHQRENRDAGTGDGVALPQEDRPSSHRITLIDNSANGTYVNVKKIGKGKRCVLHDNALITFRLSTSQFFLGFVFMLTDEWGVPLRGEKGGARVGPNLGGGGGRITPSQSSSSIPATFGRRGTPRPHSTSENSSFAGSNIPNGSRRGATRNHGSRTASGSRGHHRETIEWKIGEEMLGKGGNAEVFLGINLTNGNLIAVKRVLLPTVIKGHEDDPEAKAILQQYRSLQEEINVLSKATHPNIVQYYGSSQNSTYFNILLEFVPGGSLRHLLDNFGALSPGVIFSYLGQTLEGLQYLHDLNIVHSDIKTANILITEKGKAKLTDFGTAKLLSRPHTTGVGASLGGTLTERGPSYSGTGAGGSRLPSLQREESVSGGTAGNGGVTVHVAGTLRWMAPELVRDDPSSSVSQGPTKASDIWSVGCAMIEMMSGEAPWDEYVFESEDQIINLLKYTQEPPEIPPCSEKSDLVAIAQRCLQLDPLQRPTCEQLLLMVKEASERLSSTVTPSVSPSREVSPSLANAQGETNERAAVDMSVLIVGATGEKSIDEDANTS